MSAKPARRRAVVAPAAKKPPAAPPMPERTLVLTLALPWPLLTPNVQMYWRKKAEHVASQRRGAGYAVVTQAPANWLFDPPIDQPYFGGRVRMDVEVHPRPRMKEHDDDNFWAALKATRDGLADAGIVANDKQFRQGTLTWDKAKRTGEIVIRLTEEVGV